MTDRVPTPGKEGRVKITPENGVPFYAVMEMADEPTQEGTPLNKATFLKDATAAAYGQSPTATIPDDILQQFLKYNWRRRIISLTPSGGTPETVTILSERSSHMSETIYCSDSASLDSGGNLILSGTVSSISITYSDYSAADALKGKYFKVSANDTSTMCYYANSDAAITSARGALSGNYEVYIDAVEATDHLSYGDFEYIFSEDRSAYPDEGITPIGESTWYEYHYIGVPFDNSSLRYCATKTAVGSYTGTNDGSSSLTFEDVVLNFDFEPLFVIIYTAGANAGKGGKFGLLQGAGQSICFANFSYGTTTTTDVYMGALPLTVDSFGKTVSFQDKIEYQYSSSGAVNILAALNEAGTTYQYAAFGYGRIEEIC